MYYYSETSTFVNIFQLHVLFDALFGSVYMYRHIYDYMLSTRLDKQIKTHCSVLFKNENVTNTVTVPFLSNFFCRYKLIVQKRKQLKRLVLSNLLCKTYIYTQMDNILIL
mgnify:CR=1 FL=1